MAGGQLVRDEVGMADDDRQQVVEVVRHAAGQSAEGLHTSLHLYFALEGVALGDVAQHAQQVLAGLVDVGGGDRQVDGRPARASQRGAVVDDLAAGNEPAPDLVPPRTGRGSSS